MDCPLCGGAVRYDSSEQAELEVREFQTRRGKIEYERAARRCSRCRRIFSLLDERLKVGTEGYSPRLLQKIEYAGGNEPSFRVAGAALERLAELSISDRHVERITERLGRERAGDVRALLALLQAEALRLGEPPPNTRDNDPRGVPALTLNYVKSNTHRMDYARYRRQGLPITSALVESLIKQLNYRVKGSEKFWRSEGAEAVLQSRAAHLSEDDRATHFYGPRPPARRSARTSESELHKRSCTLE